jgi:hypothetical protein
MNLKNGASAENLYTGKQLLSNRTETTDFTTLGLHAHAEI